MALLAALESMLSAVVADGMTGDRHNSNVELVAQGIANIVSPIFGGIPATGAIARTATNIRAGARTPVSGMIHALTLLTILLVAAPLASYIPMATLAAVLFVVAYNMGEWHEIGGILRLDATAISVWVVTFALTVFADLTVAVCIGLSLAALLYIYRIADTTTVSAGDRRVHPRWTVAFAARAHSASLCHGAAHSRPVSLGHDREAGRGHSQHGGFSPVVILAAAQYVGHRRHRHPCHRDLRKAAARIRPDMLLCGAMQQPSKLLSGTRFLDRIGRENVLPNIQTALLRAEEIHDAQPVPASGAAEE